MAFVDDWIANTVRDEQPDERGLSLRTLIFWVDSFYGFVFVNSRADQKRPVGCCWVAQWKAPPP